MDNPSIQVSPSTPKFIPALVVVDMQNDFVYGSLAVPGAPDIIDTVNQIIDLPFKVKVATKDFHPENHVSFAKTHGKQLYSSATIFHPNDHQRVMGVVQTLWPSHCVAHTEGADFVRGLQTQGFNAVIHKGTHASIESYSAFRDVWNREESELPALLQKNQVTDVFHVGLAGDYCVKYTALDSVKFGYKTWIVKDAIRSISESEIAWEEMKRKEVKFITKEELVKLMENEK